MKRKPAGSGHLREVRRADGSIVYQVLVHDNGKQKSLGTYPKAKAEARLCAWYKIREEEGHFVPRDTGILTVRTLGELYLDGISPAKAKVERRRWNARVLNAEFIDWPITQVSEAAIRRWIRTMAKTPITTGKAKGLTPSHGTLATALHVLRDAFKYAVINELYDVNPADSVTITGSAMNIRKGAQAFDYLHIDEVKRVIDGERFEMPLVVHTALMLLTFAGPRPGDLYHTDWMQCDVDAGTINFYSRKRKRHYLVHLLPPAHDALRRYWLACGRPGTGLLFPGADGKPHADGYDWGWPDKRERRGGKYHLRSGEVREWKRDAVQVTPGWRTKIGIRRPLALYSLRHTCASQLLLGAELFTGGRRWSFEEIASQLGHADLTTVRKYALALGIASKQAVEESREMMGREKKKRLGE